MTYISDGSGPPLSFFDIELSSTDVTMDLTSCGLLVDRVETLTKLYAKHGNWNDVREQWFSDRLSERSTRGSAQKIYRILSSRLKNAPTALPNPSVLPGIFDQCQTSREKAQVLYPYLIEDDLLVRYVVCKYVEQHSEQDTKQIDFSDTALRAILTQIVYTDGGRFEYADSTVDRWCKGFRSVMRKIGVIDPKEPFTGKSPAIGDTALLVLMGFSSLVEDDWINAPRGFQYLFCEHTRMSELFDRGVELGEWEYIETHGSIRVAPTEPDPFAFAQQRGGC